MSDFSWSDESVAELGKLWSEGHSAAEIARRLEAKEGGSLTRSAVLGKVHRLKLSGRRVETRQKNGPRAPKVRKPRVPAERRQPRAPQPPRKYFSTRPTPPPIDIPEPISLKVALLDLAPSMCKWPTGHPGDPGFSFCGAKNDSISTPYCKYHHRLAYVPIVHKKRANKLARFHASISDRLNLTPKDEAWMS